MVGGGMGTGMTTVRGQEEEGGKGAEEGAVERGEGRLATPTTMGSTAAAARSTNELTAGRTGP